MNLSVKARVIIGVVAVAIGATFGWLTRDRLDPERYGVDVRRYEAGGPGVDGPRDQIAVRARDASDALLVLLHGRGSSPEGMLSNELFDALAELGDEAPTVVFPDGGESSYWHDRDDGAWATYVLDEVIPAAVERFGLDGSRVAIGGMSMGGFGALSLGFELPDRFCAVGGHSPAVFASWPDAASGAFDDEADFARHDLLSRARDGEVAAPVWIDVGDDDPFEATATELGARLGSAGTDVESHVFPGGHDEAYWWGNIDRYLDFYATALGDC